jgi:uncharacterized protein (TIGR03437 family)
LRHDTPYQISSTCVCNRTSTNGTTPAAVGVSVDPSRLSTGTYQGVIQINAQGSVQPQMLVSVTANVTAVNAPNISIDQPQLVLSTQTGGAPISRVLTVSNAGGGTLNLTATATTSAGGNWLSVSPTSGTATPAVALHLIVSVNSGSLVPGTYSGKIMISSDQGQAAVAVTLAVSTPQANLLLSQTGLTFTAVAQGGVVPPQSFGILNTGAGPMTWTASSSTLSGGPNWLSVGPNSGTVPRSYLDVSIVTVSIDSSGLAPGDYYGRININAGGASNSPQAVTIVLNVLPPGSNPGPMVNPTGLIFTGISRSNNPGSQTVLISNITSAPINYGSIQTYVIPGNWLVNIPANATVNPTTPVQMVVQPDFTALSSGVSRAFVTLGFSDGSSRIVNVLSVVAPEGTLSAKSSEQSAASCTPTTLQIVPTSVQQSFTASLNQPTTLEAQVVDDCGLVLTPDRGGAAVKTTFSNGDVGLSMVHTMQGHWVGTWQPRNASSGNVRATITAFLSLANGKTIANQIDLSVNLVNGAKVPLLSPGQVSNAASSVTQAPVAPGTLIQIKGSQLADTTALSDVPFQTILAGTQAFLNGQPIPLQYASDGQLNAQVPYEVPINAELQLLVQRGTALSLGDSLTVALAQPAIFTVDSSGQGQGVIVNATTGVVADSAAPASAGDLIRIYATGVGAVNPQVATGAGAPESPAVQAINTVTVMIAGVAAETKSATLAPGIPGVYFVTVTVPSGVPPGPAVPVLLTVTGQTSPPVTMAVQ